MADFEFRHLRPNDFPFCWSLYSETIAPMMPGWNEPAQRRAVEQVLSEEGSSILAAGGSDAGWLHVAETRFDIHLDHLYLDAASRNRGLGTRLLVWMSDCARRKAKDFTLDAPAAGRARRLFERRGFRAVRTSGGRMKMLLGER